MIAAIDTLNHLLTVADSAKHVYQTTQNLFVSTASKEVWLISEARVELAVLHISRSFKGGRS